VIVDDVTYITGPFQDGVVAQAVNYVASQGVSYFTAAGNTGTSAYGSVFNAAPARPELPAPRIILAEVFAERLSYTRNIYHRTAMAGLDHLGQDTTGTRTIWISIDGFFRKNTFGFNRNHLS
jgi:subtilisin family serine protease